MKQDNPGYRWLACSMMAVFVIAVLLVCMISVFYDPFHYYVPPDASKAVFSDNARYQNPALLKHLEYDTILVGTSRSQNFTADMFKQSGWKVLKVAADGSSALLHQLTIEKAIKEDKVDRVILEIARQSYEQGPEWTNDKSTIPFHLYRNTVETPFIHLLSFEYFPRDSEEPLEQKDIPRYLADLGMWYDTHKWKFGPAVYAAVSKKVDRLCAGLRKDRYRRNEEVTPLTEEAIEKNLVAVMSANPDREFIGFFPPISSIKDLRAPAQHAMRKAFRRMVIQVAQKLRNFTLYDFAVMADVVNDLSRFKDYNHFDIEIQQDIARELARKNSQYRVRDYQVYLRDDPLTDTILRFNPKQLAACGGSKGAITRKALLAELRTAYRELRQVSGRSSTQKTPQLERFERAISLSGDWQWRLRLAKSYLFGWGGPKDPLSALKIASEKAYDYLPEGMFLRGLSLITVDKVKNAKEGIELIKTAARYRDKSALAFLEGKD